MRKLVLLTLLFAAAALIAEQNADQKKGFNADNVYLLHDIDTINAFNGNLTITIPIGARYPIAEGFNYGLTLHSNANLWESEIVWDQDGDFSPHASGVSTQAFDSCNREDGVRVARPHMAANAGLGWTMTLGRLLGPASSEELSRHGGAWIYESPDGAEHMFYEVLHNDPNTESDTPDDVMYTQDQSFLRMQYDETTDTRIIEFPDGSVHTFTPPACGTGWWMPSRITNRHSANFLKITYQPNDLGGTDWILEDNHLRRHVVSFKPTNWDKGPHEVVDTVTLKAFGGADDAVYKFHYTEKRIARPDWSEKCFGYDSQAAVAVLDRIELPVDPDVAGETATDYSFLYDFSMFEAGLPFEATLPTGGRIRWTFGPYEKPVEGGDVVVPTTVGSWGVHKRELLMPGATTPHATWEYKPQLGVHDLQFPTEDDRLRDMRNLVTDPTGTRIASWFSVSRFDLHFWKGIEYGKPFTRRFSDGDGRFLSEVTYPPNVEIEYGDALKNAMRAKFVRYGFEDTTFGHDGDRQWRLESVRVIHYNTIGGVVSDVITDYSEFDGLGHARKTEVRKPDNSEKKTTITWFNPGRTSLTAEFPKNEPWVTNTFSYTETTFDGQTSRTEFCFDENTGFLQRKRVFRSNDRSHDLLAEFTDSTNDGSVDKEEYWGGDDRPLTGIDSTCDVNDDPSSTKKYTILHGSSFGVRNSTEYSGFGFKSLDLTIDKWSGLPSASRDTAKVQTTFDYNPRGQLRSVSPADDATTEYTYGVTPTEFPAASVIAKQIGGGSTLTEARYYYDAFGRRIQQRQRMPLADGQWSVADTAYDALGRAATQFVARSSSSGDYDDVPQGLHATVTAYEPLGRPQTITQPDGSVTRFTYTGTSESIRKSNIETVAGPEEVATVENYDVHGRLISVREGVTASDAGEVTTYEYDEGDRLTDVHQGVQARTFDYDGAGLLMSEKHPETKNLATTYAYDARGHMTEKLDPKQVRTRYDYDGAERLTDVTETTNQAAPVPLKKFTYGDTGTAKGKMLTAKRHNHLPGIGDVEVTETFAYDEDGGRLSSKTTSVDGPGDFDDATFTDHYEYNDLGALELLTYPTCSGCGGLEAPARSVTTSYENGQVTGVAPYTMPRGILYHANGLLHSIRRQKPDGNPGALWEQHIAANGIARPDRTAVSNFCTDLKINDASLPAEKSVEYGASANIEVPVTGATTYQWYLGDEAISGQNTNHLTAAVFASGNYWLRAGNGTCTADSRTFTVRIVGCEPTPPVMAAPTEIRPGQVLSASIPDGAATHEWTITNGAFTQPNPTGPTVSFTTASCSGTVTLSVKTNCHATPVTQTVTIVAPAIAILDESRTINRGETTVLHARLTGAPPWSITWSDGHVQSNLTESEVAREIAPDVTTTYSITSATVHGCPVTVNDSVTITVEECRPILTQPESVTIQSGGTATFTVGAITDATFKWYEGFQGDTSHPITAELDNVLQVTGVSQTSYYWCRVTSPTPGCMQDTNTVAAYVCTDAAITGPQQDYSGSPYLMAVADTIALDVTTSGTIVAHQWLVETKNDDQSPWSAPVLVSETPRFTWTAQAGDAGKSFRFYARVNGACANGLAAQRLVKEVKILAANPSCPTPDIFSFPATEIAVGHNGPALLYANVLPYPHRPGLEDPANLEYRWYVDGNLLLWGDGVTPFDNHQYTPAVHTTQAVTVEVRRKNCSNSPTARLTMFLYNDIDCPPPPLSVNREAVTHNDTGAKRTFRAYSPWPSVTFEWFRGDTGDTRNWYGTGVELSIPAGDVGTYWVRATSPCGTTSDSPTLTTSIAGCAPVRITVQPQTAEVQANTAKELTFETIGNPTHYNWFHSESPNSIAITKNYTARPTRTTTYWAQAAIPGCHVAMTIPATLHVTSCDDIQVTQPPQTKSINAGSSAILSVSATTSGSTLSYRWFEGERGDVSTPATAVQATPEFETSPAQTTRYWVRVMRAGGCEIDLNAVTVYVCRTPTIPSQTTHYFSYSPQHTQRLRAYADGDNLSYRWYKGAVGDTSTPVSDQATYYTSPNITTLYWFRVTSDCFGDIADRTADSPQVTVTLCPVITAEPVAAKPEVMPNTGTKLTIGVDRVALPSQIKWYRGNKYDRSNPVGTGYEFVTPNLTVDTTYWAEAISGTCAIESEIVTVKICRTPSVRWHDSARSKVAVGESQNLFVSPTTNTNLTWTWYKGTSGNVAGSQLLSGPGPTNISHTTGPITVKTSFWCRVTEPSGCYADTPTLEIDPCKPTITAQPQGSMINGGATATLSVTANGGPLTYQWYRGASGDVTNLLAGQTAATLSVSPTSDTSYWVRVTGCTYSADSNAATISVCQPPAITQQPSSTTTGANVNTTLAVTATGTNLTYQWYVGTSGVTTSPVQGATNATYTVSPSTTTNYWVKVSGLCGAAVNSTTAKVSVAPVITTQPVGGWVMSGTTRTLTVAATGTELRYTWQVNGVEISGATSASYTTPPITSNTTYTARVWSGTAWRDSAAATLTVCTRPITAWHSSVKTSVAEGEAQTLYLNTTSSGNYAVSYTWYRGGNSGDVAGSTLISGPGATNISASIAPTVTTKYWARVSESSGCYADTPTLTVNVCVPTITTQPVATTMIDKVSNPSASTTLSVAANGGALTYQWYIGQPGTTTQPIAGATSNTYTASPNADTTYWVRVTGSCGVSRDSTAALVMLCQAPAITSQPFSQIAASNTNTTLSVGATGTDLTYQWYVGTTGVTTSPVSGATNATYVVSPSVTTDYWVKVSGRCGTVNSTTAKISVAPTITTQPVGGWVMSGTTRTLTVAASGTQLSYAWLDNGVTISGATSASYTTPPVTTNKNYSVRVSSGTASRTSDVAALTVCTRPLVSWHSSVKTKIAQGESQNLYLSVTASGNYSVSYTWYRGGNSGDVAGSTLISGPGATNISATVAPTVTTKYWARVSESSGCYADTPTLTVQVCVPAITTQPIASVMLDKVSNPSASTTLSVAANGGALTYQWYIGDPGNTAQPIAGATASSYTASPNTNTTYWVRVTGSCGISADSTASVVTLCQATAITSQPFSRTVTANTNTSMSVAANGTDLTYQWYVGTSGSTTNPISGAVSDSYIASPNYTTDYWVKVTGRCGTVNSNTVKLSVAPTITAQPVGGAVTKGTTRTLTVAATGTQLTYEWFLGAGTTTRVATTASYTTPALNADAIYWARVTSGYASRDSAQAVFTICQPRTAVITSNSSVSGAPVNLNVNASASGETYQWYRGESGDTSVQVGSIGPITVSPLETTRYWVRTTRSTCTADSPAVTVLVCYPKITTQPQSAMITTGQTRTLTVAATGTPALSYQWFRGVSGDTSAPVGTGTSFTTPALSTTTNYWVRVTTSASACGTTNKVDSETATVSVCRPPAITLQPQSSTVAYSYYEVVLSVEATGDNLTYQWYEGSAGVTTTPVGTNEPTLTIVPGHTKSYWVRVSGTCGTVNSTAAQLSVTPTIQIQPSPTTRTVCRNTTVQYSINASANPISYEWYRMPDGVYTPELIGTSSVVNVVASANMEVWCRVRSGDAFVTSRQVDINVIDGPSVTISKMQPSGTSWKLTAHVPTADKPYVTYAWYVGAVGNTSSGLVGNDSSLYYFSTNPNSFWVRVTRTDTGCSTDAGVSVP